MKVRKEIIWGLGIIAQQSNGNGIEQRRSRDLAKKSKETFFYWDSEALGQVTVFSSCAVSHRGSKQTFLRPEMGHVPVRGRKTWMIFSTRSVVQRDCSHRKIRFFLLEKKKDVKGKKNTMSTIFHSLVIQHLHTILYIRSFQNFSCQTTMCTWLNPYLHPTLRDIILYVLLSVFWGMRLACVPLSYNAFVLF